MKIINIDSSNSSKVRGIFSVTKKRSLNRKNKILLTQNIKYSDIGWGGIITTQKTQRENAITISQESFEKFGEYDIVDILCGEIVFLWEYENDDNCFFLTDSCSCKCVMCPQPPKAHNKELEIKNLKILELIPNHYKKSICITGGEPTLLQEYYLQFMQKIREKFPHNFLITLSNGRTFNNLVFLNKFAKLKSNSLVAISFASDIDTLHDEIMGAKNSFHQMHNGIYNLAKAGEKIELRIVVSRLNFKRLPTIADFIYRNYPFVFHIAIMGLEYTGYAIDNYEKININPKEYANELQEAIYKLNRYGLNVSIYNIPLCLLNKNIRRFATKSISKWKNDYAKECLKCDVKDKCCGIFTTSNKYPYTNIAPIKVV
ncbi:His-Xaa-Ser system radical SAM maturase HxsC [Helicobacter sp. 16-1353]|uniref:His-Xaa-Ser system radical SAM maturase HxsC n=1 Tax=Helicobacter sp. 16-1353 TaxID=2004996 RepID=UPI000DCDD72B|nr:His-Xaa-Ser system radical SAM maturase HxsC [Helicobacter sp. 16-1353]RAX54010.1 His-Xaa-Ser system radical SAM maturase HxsC [Helicobacter sp. 16-1353]